MKQKAGINYLKKIIILFIIINCKFYTC